MNDAVAEILHQLNEVQQNVRQLRQTRAMLEGQLAETNDKLDQDVQRLAELQDSLASAVADSNRHALEGE